MSALLCRRGSIRISDGGGTIYLLLIYILPLLLILAIYLYHRQKREKQDRILQKEQFEAGLTEPASLHPVIDFAKCVGCTACADACPEHNVLGIINGKAALVSPANCIGHGACRVACPVDAITLVFGTEKRGVDIPMVKPNFETNIPGIFIAGELGGMGLIRNAIEQGRQAMASIAAIIGKGQKTGDIHDVVIVGAGPAGFSASLAAMERGLDYVTLEQEALGGTVAHYPRGKIVMTQPARLPIVGKVHFKETTKEHLLNFWRDTERKLNVKINYGECVEKVAPGENYVTVTTRKMVYKARTVLLAIGRRGNPRKLDVPGEEKNKVVYRFIDPLQYQSRHVLVVGGGDSALEAALAVAGTPRTTVTLSYRGEAFSRVKQKNRDGLQAAQQQGRLGVLLNSNVLEIRDSDVILEQQGKRLEIRNDAVIVCAGGILPTAFLREISIHVETKHGKA